MYQHYYNTRSKLNNSKNDEIPYKFKPTHKILLPREHIEKKEDILLISKSVPENIFFKNMETNKEEVNVETIDLNTIGVNNNFNDAKDCSQLIIPTTPPTPAAPQQQYERILIFDVETTGFPSKTYTSTVDQPYIIQLSFVIVSIYKTNKIINKYVVEKKYNNYISIHPNIVISEKITEITGITRDICDKEGVPIINLLVDFYKEYIRCNYIVSHNIAFDSKMMLLEFERNYHELIKSGCSNPHALFNPMFNNMNNIKLYCTMTEGKHVTNIYVNRKIKETNNCTNCSCNCHATTETPETHTESFKKMPKLIELYQHLYPNEPVPQNLHNSLVDTLVCMNCFLKMKYMLSVTTSITDML
jgi:DNA polymerase III epsilon subunit-like protein